MRMGGGQMSQKTIEENILSLRSIEFEMQGIIECLLRTETKKFEIIMVIMGPIIHI